MFVLTRHDRRGGRQMARDDVGAVVQATDVKEGVIGMREWFWKCRMRMKYPLEVDESMTEVYMGRSTTEASPPPDEYVGDDDE